MIDGVPVIAVVPARGGSKGLPGKNLKRVGGVTLIGRAVEAARASAHVDRVVASTDCPRLAAEALRRGAEVPFLRPAELATDTATTADVVLHALDYLKVQSGFLVLLQPTSPLRTAADIDGAIRACHAAGAPAAVGVTEIETSPYWIYHLGDGDRLAPVVPIGARPKRRQDSPAAFALNGAVYVVDVAHFRARRDFVPEGAVAWVMPSERSIDIDTAEDLSEARRLVARASNGARRKLDRPENRTTLVHGRRAHVARRVDTSTQKL